MGLDPYGGVGYSLETVALFLSRGKLGPFDSSPKREGQNLLVDPGC